MKNQPPVVTRISKHAKLPYLMTDAVTRGCQKCKQSILAGERHWFDPATRNRFHQACRSDDALRPTEVSPA